MMQSELYQSILRQLSEMPVEHLQEADDFLSEVLSKSESELKKRRAEIREKTLALAGSWNDMPDEDLENMMRYIKESRKE